MKTNGLEVCCRLRSPAYKIGSASVTDFPLLEKIRSKGHPVIMSSGMSTMDEIRTGANTLGLDSLLICHSTSAYPCDPTELNLNMIHTLAAEFDVADRLLRPRNWSFNHRRGCGTGGLFGRASHHCKQSNVGQRSGSIGRTSRCCTARQRHTCCRIRTR